MRAYTRWTLMMSCALVGAGSLLAQEKAPEEKPAKEEESRRVGWVFGEFSYWITQPSGLEYAPATVVNRDDPFGTTVLAFPESTSTRPRSGAGYAFKDNIGEIAFTYWSNRDITTRSEFSPSNFVIGEVQSFPYHLGVFDNGLADAFRSRAQTGIRDFRLDFYRAAIDTRRLKGRWFVGFRRISHQRDLVTDYYALVAGMPLVISPTNNTIQHNLDPIPDHAESSSRFSGRGLEAGVELAFPIKGKVSANAGFSLAALRGSSSSRYVSTTSQYTQTINGQKTTLTAPFDLGTDPATGNSTVQQDILRIGLLTRGGSANAQVLEGFLECRWNVWKALETFAGFRSIRYDHVGADIRPDTIAPTPTGVINVTTFSRIDHAAHYEGYYAGISYRY